VVYFHRNDKEHIIPYFDALKNFIIESSLINNQYLNDIEKFQAHKIVESDFLEFMTYYLWVTKTRNDSLKREKYKLKQKLKKRKRIKSIIKRLYLKAFGFLNIKLKG